MFIAYFVGFEWQNASDTFWWWLANSVVHLFSGGPRWLYIYRAIMLHIYYLLSQIHEIWIMRYRDKFCIVMKPKYRIIFRFWDTLYSSVLGFVCGIKARTNDWQQNHHITLLGAEIFCGNHRFHLVSLGWNLVWTQIFLTQALDGWNAVHISLYLPTPCRHRRI